MHLTAKFQHPTFNRSEVIVLTTVHYLLFAIGRKDYYDVSGLYTVNYKQTDATENIHLTPLSYASGSTLATCVMNEHWLTRFYIIH